MNYSPLGEEGPSTSRICLGTNNFGKQLDEAAAKSVVSRAIDVGINMLDTADVYNEGRSEEIIGRALQGRRGDIILASKGGLVTDGGPRTVNLSAKYIDRKVTESLKRLRTDYIDLYYLHRFDPETPLEESMKVMDSLVRSGKVKYIGVSNFTVEQLDNALQVCERLGLARPVALQTQYSLLARSAANDLIPYSVVKHISFFAYSPLWGGFLTGKYKRGELPPEGSRGKANRRYWERVEREGNFDLVDRLREFAGGAGVSLRELALSWVLNTPGVTAPVVGASTPEQVSENARAAETALDSHVAAELSRILS